MTKSRDAATSGEQWSRCRHRLRLQLPLPWSLIPVCISRCQCICKDHWGFCISDGGRQVFRTAERSGSASNAGCGAGYYITRSVCLCDSAGCWCGTTACTQCGGWSNHLPLLCSGLGGSHPLGDIVITRIVQRRWGGGVLILECGGYGTHSLIGIPLARRYGNRSHSRGKLRNSWRPRVFLILTISKSWNISYDLRGEKVWELRRHYPIRMFEDKTAGIISSECICNGRRGRLLCERPWRDLTTKGGAVLTALDPKPSQYSGTRAFQKHSIMGLTAIRLNSY